MIGSPLQINTPADLARTIAMAEAHGSIGFVRLARGLAGGEFAFDPIPPDASARRFKRFARATNGRTAIILIGDDDGADRGPTGWKTATRAVEWARVIMVHGAGAEPKHYEAAIMAAHLARRCLIVECSAATLPEWERLVRVAAHRPPTLIIRPRGGVHPLPVAREALH